VGQGRSDRPLGAAHPRRVPSRPCGISMVIGTLTLEGRAMLATDRGSMLRAARVFAFLAGGCVSLLSAQNLVDNPHFDSGLDGWQQTLNLASWDGTLDAGDSPTSG